MEFEFQKWISAKFGYIFSQLMKFSGPSFKPDFVLQLFSNQSRDDLTSWWAMVWVKNKCLWKQWLAGPLFLDHFEWKVYRWWVAGRKGNQYWRCTRYRDLQYCQNDRPCRHTSIFIFCLIPLKLLSKLFSDNLTQEDSVRVILCSFSRIVSLIP